MTSALTKDAELTVERLDEIERKWELRPDRWLIACKDAAEAKQIIASARKGIEAQELLKYAEEAFELLKLTFYAHRPINEEQLVYIDRRIDALLMKAIYGVPPQAHSSTGEDSEGWCSTQPDPLGRAPTSSTEGKERHLTKIEQLGMERALRLRGRPIEPSPGEDDICPKHKAEVERDRLRACLESIAMRDRFLGELQEPRAAQEARAVLAQEDEG